MKVDIKYVLIIIIVLLLMIGGTGIAGIIGEQVPRSWTRDSNLDANVIQKVKDYSGVIDFNVLIGEIECDGIKCKADVFQQGVINTFWTGEQIHCGEHDTNYTYHYDLNIDTNTMNETITETVFCKTYVDYTKEENQIRIQGFIDNKIENWVEAKDIRTTKTITRTDGGVVGERTR